MTVDFLVTYQNYNNQFIKECERYCDIAAKYNHLWNCVTDFCLHEDSNTVECSGLDMLGRYVNLQFDVRFLLLSNEELDHRAKKMYSK